MSSSPMDRKNYKCPCCNNPWGAATGEFFAKLCQTCDDSTTSASPNDKPISRDNIDPSVLPSTNFYQYSNGKWLQNNPIPSGYPNWNNFLILHTKSQENLKTILEGLREGNGSGTECTEEEAKVATFFAAAMDEATIEAAGVEPVRPILQVVDKAVAAHMNGAKAELAEQLGLMALEFGISFFFSIGVSPDNDNTDHSILQVSQGGLGLPDRDYYFDETKQDQREAYKDAAAFMLTLLADPSATEATEENKAMAIKVFDLEKSLAEKHMTKTENRDPHATFNKMIVTDFVNTTGNGSFDFVAYLEAATGKTAHEGLGEINIRNVEALKRVAEVISSVDDATLEYYLRWHVVKSCAPYLSQALVQAHFDFYEKTLMGTQEIKPRWKRAMAFTETALGEALGKLYCAKYFDETSKERALKVVEKVRQALEERLKEVDWMKADSTRAEALKKMSKFGVKIGYPDKWTDYGSLVITAEMSFLDMVMASRKFDRLQDIKEMNAPTDKLKWFMTPQTINA